MLPGRPRSRAALISASALILALALLSLVALADPTAARPFSAAAAAARGPLLVFSDLQGASSLLWAADPDDLSRRWRLGTVPHRAG
ncbi:MAG: hypothetical protein HY689_07045, partial [Chloroflexi bacterium]|nr:hypothetical protein [Chloroflexota bacterium]